MENENQNAGAQTPATSDAENTATTSVQTETTDNSANEDATLEEQVAKALEEPGESVEGNEDPNNGEGTVQTKTNEDNSPNKDCPDKFKNEDGTVNIENLLKSYKELEPMVQEKAKWEKERADLLESKKQLDELNKQKEEQARQAGYDSTVDMENAYKIAELEANEYAKYLRFTENPEEVRQKLIDYLNYPNAELMEEIEMEFSPEINKQVAVLADRARRDFEVQKEQQVETQKLANIENVIKDSVKENSEIFGYEPFKQLFISTLQKFGDTFTSDDAKALIKAATDLKEAFKAEFEKQSGIKLQNKEATDKLASLNTQNSAPAASQKYTNADIEKMSESELAKVISELI